MSAGELKQLSAAKWQEKIHPMYLPMGYVTILQEVETYIKKIEDTLSEGEMEGLGYQSQEEKIEETGAGIGYLNAYISSLPWELYGKIDQPLYQGFQNDAAEDLSRIRMEDYTTENTLQIKVHREVNGGAGKPYGYDTGAAALTMKDFLGLTSLGGEEKTGNLAGVPKEFKDFTKLFAMDYDRIKNDLKDGEGSPVSLEDYLNTLHTYGEFDNKMDKPVLEFVSGLLDVTVVKPLIEMCTGYDLITGEDLSDFERGMKGVSAAVDVVTLMVGIKASGAVKLFSRDALQFTGKTMALDLLANGAAYGVGKAGEELGLPLPVTLLLSLGAGVTVSLKAGKYIFKDSAGNVVLEAGEQEVRALKESRAFNIDEIRPLLKTKPDTAFFWSGRTDGIGGADVAADIATGKGGVTLETTIGSKNIKMPEWDFSNPSSMDAWDLASGAYAEQVSGEIRAVVGSELRTGNIWENIELPRLKANPNVTKITTIDPKTGIEKIIFER